MTGQQIDPAQLRSGAVIKVQIQGFLGLYWHFGVVSDRRDYRGVPLVISNSWANGRAKEELWETFSAGQICHVVGFPSTLSSGEVIANARRLSSKAYNLFFWDCERFANACHGLQPRSTQLEITMLAACVGALVLASQN